MQIAAALKKLANIMCCIVQYNQIKGDITHTVSRNLIFILSTYRVVLHPS